MDSGQFTLQTTHTQRITELDIYFRRRSYYKQQTTLFYEHNGQTILKDRLHAAEITTCQHRTTQHS